MGAVVKLGIDELPGALDLGEQRIRRAVVQGTLAGAHRGRAIIVNRTPTDQGPMRAAWKVKPGAHEFTGFSETLAELINDAPQISTVELGARPHAVNPEGWQAIYEWVRRHYRSAAGGVYTLGGAGRMVKRGKAAVTGPFKGDDPRVEAITNAIVWKIRKHGQKATLFVRNSIDDLHAVMATELQRHLAQANKDAAKGGKP